MRSKAILRKLHNAFNSSEELKLSSKEHRDFLFYWSQGYINEKAFSVVENRKFDYYTFTSKQYPLTIKGQEYLDQSKYLQIRNSLPASIISDILLTTAFIFTLILTIKDIFK